MPTPFDRLRCQISVQGFAIGFLPDSKIQLNASELALFQRLIQENLPIKKNGDLIVPLDVWIKPDQICKITGCILSIWRDNGERNKRPKGRFRFYLNEIGIDKFRKLVEERFGSLENDPGSLFAQNPRSYFGIHPQKQTQKY